MKKIHWGMIGCGDVTEKKSGPGFQLAKGSELVAVMRRDGEGAKDYARRHGVPKWYDDAQKLIDDPEIDAVYIATPPSSHRDYAIAAARAGKPVYVEKPMALSYHECQEMVQFCEEVHIPLFVAYYRRALPRFLKVKSLIDEGAIGRIRCVTMQLIQPPSDRDLVGEKHWRVDPSVAGCGYFCDLGSHMLDLIQFLLGPITSASGATINQAKLYKSEDLVVSHFGFRNGIQGTGTWCFTAHDHLDRTEITGSHGTLTYANFLNQPVLLNRSGQEESFVIDNPDPIQQPLIQKITDELLGNGKSPSTGSSASLTAWVMDKILGRI